MKIIKKLDIYVFLEMIIPFFISLMVCLFIFMMIHLLKITEIIVSYGANLFHVCLLIFYGMPYFLQYVIPISVMVAVLIVCLQMSENNEIVALKASGIGTHHIIKPVILFSTIGVIITASVTLFAVPLGERFFKLLYKDIVVSGIGMGLKERTFNNRFDDLMIYVGELNHENGSVYDVFIEDNRIEGIKNTIVAPRGKLITAYDNSAIHLNLYDGIIGRVDINKKNVHYAGFDTYFLHLNIDDISLDVHLHNSNVKEMNLLELKAFINSKNVCDNKYLLAKIQYYKMFSIPFSCLSMSFLSLSMGIYNLKLTKSLGIGLSIVAFLIYYILLSVSIFLCKLNLCIPVIGMWLPNIITGLLGFFLFFKAK